MLAAWISDVVADYTSTSTNESGIRPQEILSPTGPGATELVSRQKVQLHSVCSKCRWSGCFSCNGALQGSVATTLTRVALQWDTSSCLVYNCSFFCGLTFWEGWWCKMLGRTKVLLGKRMFMPTSLLIPWLPYVRLCPSMQTFSILHVFRCAPF